MVIEFSDTLASFPISKSLRAMIVTKIRYFRRNSCRLRKTCTEFVRTGRNSKKLVSSSSWFRSSVSDWFGEAEGDDGSRCWRQIKDSAFILINQKVNYKNVVDLDFATVSHSHTSYKKKEDFPWKKKKNLWIFIVQ